LSLAFLHDFGQFLGVSLGFFGAFLGQLGLAAMKSSMPLVVARSRMFSTQSSMVF